MYLEARDGDIPWRILGARPAIERVFRNMAPVTAAKTTLRDQVQSRITRFSRAKKLIATYRSPVKLRNYQVSLLSRAVGSHIRREQELPHRRRHAYVVTQELLKIRAELRDGAFAQHPRVIKLLAHERAANIQRNRVPRTSRSVHPSSMPTTHIKANRIARPQVIEDNFGRVKL